MNKRAFTLIEIIVCIILISIISLVIVTKLPSNNKKDNKVEVENALLIATTQLKDKKELKSYTISNQNDIYYCVSKKYLVGEGLLETKDLLNEIPDNSYYKIKLNSLGVIESIEEASKTDCKYYSANISKIENEDMSFSGGEENDSYSVKQSLNQDISNKNIYNVSINMTKDIYSKKVAPVYVLFVWDTSGSMSWNDSSYNAKNAIKDFSNTILTEVINSKIGFLPFANRANPYYFSGSNLWGTNTDAMNNAINSTRYGGSNSYSSAYKAILNSSIYNISGIKRNDPNSILYIVLFSDAGDDEDCDAYYNRDYVVNQISPIIDKFIFIAYNPGNVNCLSSFSTQINNKYTNRSIYALSSSSTIKNDLINIGNEVKESTKYKNVEISIKINEEFFDLIKGTNDDITYNLSNNTITKKIDFNKDDIEKLNDEIDFSILFKSINFSTNINKDLNMIKNMTLKFTRKDNTVDNIELDANSLPKVSISTKEEYAINQ